MRGAEWTALVVCGREGGEGEEEVACVICMTALEAGATKRNLSNDFPRLCRLFVA